MTEKTPPRLVWCLGMVASGSTWLFNATRAVAAVLYPGARVTGCFAGHFRDLRKLPGLDALNVVKTHGLPATAAAFMGAQANVILISLRDPRDAVTSMLQHMGEDFPTALTRMEKSARMAAAFARDPRALVLGYENGFTEGETVFDDLAAALGGRLTTAQRGALFAATRRERIEEKIFRLEELPTARYAPGTDDLLDHDTQWHRHHAGRSGESGRWRHLLPPHQAMAIEHRMAEFMREFGYTRG